MTRASTITKHQRHANEIVFAAVAAKKAGKTRLHATLRLKLKKVHARIWRCIRDGGVY